MPVCVCAYVCMCKVKAQKKRLLPQSKRYLVRVKAVVFGFIIAMEVRNLMIILLKHQNHCVYLLYMHFFLVLITLYFRIEIQEKLVFL